MSEDNNSNSAAPMWSDGGALPVTHGDNAGEAIINQVDGFIWQNPEPPTLDFNIPALAERLMPEILRRLAHPEARAIAEAAVADSPKQVDTLALSALADWLEERMYGDIAGRVRRLAAQDGDMLVITAGSGSDSDDIHALKQAADSIVRFWRSRGMEVGHVVLPYGYKMELLRPTKPQ